MLSKKQKISIWMLYLIFKPLLFYIAYIFSPNPQSVFTIEFGLFIILGITVSFFPIQTEDSIFFLITGVSLAAYVIFGLFPELIITTVSVTALMIKSNIKSDEHYRYAVNLLMFQVLSLIAALSYHAVNELSVFSHTLSFSIVALFVYMIVHLISNQIFLYVFSRYLYQRKNIEFFDQHFVFSLNSSLVLVSLTFVLIYLYDSLGVSGVVIGALPFVTLTIGINVYFNHKLHNDYLEQVNVYARNLTVMKKKEEVINTYIKLLVKIFPVDTVSYYKVSDDELLVKTLFFQKQTGLHEIVEPTHLGDQSILRKSLANRSILSYNRSIDWKPFCKNEITYLAESALVLPVEQNDQLIGLMLLSHQTKNMYNDMLISLVDLFHKYFGIALDNAHHYEALEEKNETDFLTNLTNLKGFSKKVESVLEKEEIEKVSIVVLDLDHFKKTNDTYGHQAGNEVLKQLARLLQTCSSGKGTVARFGGEEFIILLEDHTKEEASQLAESIRQKVETTYFIITQSIQNNNHVKLKLTVSLGVASYPADSSDMQEVIMIADKAMYMGSKQKGRNRVTVANEGSNDNEKNV